MLDNKIVKMDSYKWIGFFHFLKSIVLMAVFLMVGTTLAYADVGYFGYLFGFFYVTFLKRRSY